MMRTLPIVIVLFVTAAVSPTSAQPENAKVSTYLSGKRSGFTYTGKPIAFEWLFAPFDGREIDGWVGGDSLDPPSYVVKSLKLSVEGKAYEIPKQAYCDIYDPPVQGFGIFVIEDSKVSIWLWRHQTALEAHKFGFASLKVSLLRGW